MHVTSFRLQEIPCAHIFGRGPCLRSSMLRGWVCENKGQSPPAEYSRGGLEKEEVSTTKYSTLLSVWSWRIHSKNPFWSPRWVNTPHLQHILSLMSGKGWHNKYLLHNLSEGKGESTQRLEDKVTRVSSLTELVSSSWNFFYSLSFWR